MFRSVASLYLLSLTGLPAALYGQTDVIFVGAKVFTGDSNRPAAAAVALRGEKILAVGTAKEIQLRMEIWC